MANFGDLKSDKGLAALNAFLLTRSYIDGFKPSGADAATFAQLTAVVDDVKYPNVARWAAHIGSFSVCKRKAWGGAAAAAAGKAEVKAAAPAAAAAAEDDGDPFAEKPAAAEKSPFEMDDDDMTEEEKERERIIAEKAKKLNDERAAKGKKKEAGRSTLILDVKPLGSDTDMKELEGMVRKIEMDGLRWAGSELVPIGYGVKKLRIISVIVDDLVSTDVLQDGFYYARFQEVTVECYDAPPAAQQKGKKTYKYTDYAGTNNTVAITDDEVILGSLAGTGEKPGEVQKGTQSLAMVPGGNPGGGNRAEETGSSSSSNSNSDTTNPSGSSTDNTFTQGGNAGTALEPGFGRIGGPAIAIVVAILGLMAL